MKKEYRKHIASNSQHQVWLHRTHVSNIEDILKEGLRFGTDLSTTATLQSRNLEEAESSYRMSHKGNNAVVVIKIPRQIADKYYTSEKGIKGSEHQGYEGG